MVICEPGPADDQTAGEGGRGNVQNRQKGDGRTALDYGWSGGSRRRPGRWPASFQALQRDPDPGVRWIVTENSKKARLAKLLG